MGKRFDRLWPEIISFSNLLLAFKKAARGKRSKPAVAAFEYDLESNLVNLQDDLRSGVYQPGGYRSFYIYDTKPRLISAAPFYDRIVHHALVNVLEPLYERLFIHDSYASRKKKGTHKALDRCTYFMRRYEYVLPLDVRQFFPSVDHALLEGILAQTIADEQALDLCRKIIASGRDVLRAEYTPVYFPGDDLFAPMRPRGLPIGNQTSQFWANVYLNGLDHFIKRELKCRGYVRYVDDMRLFADDKDELHTWREAIIASLAGLRLTVHENSAQPRPCGIGVPFLGFQVFPDHRRLKRRNAVRARQRLKWLKRQAGAGQITSLRLEAGVDGWLAHIRAGDTWGLSWAILKSAGVTGMSKTLRVFGNP